MPCSSKTQTDHLPRSMRKKTRCDFEARSNLYPAGGGVFCIALYICNAPLGGQQGYNEMVTLKHSGQDLSVREIHTICRLPDFGKDIYYGFEIGSDIRQALSECIRTWTPDFTGKGPSGGLGSPCLESYQ